VAGLPWFLLAVGILLVVVGSILPGPSDRRRRAIDPDMRDADIARELERGERMTAANFVILAGLACIAVSVCWRLLRALL